MNNLYMRTALLSLLLSCLLTGTVFAQPVKSETPEAFSKRMEWFDEAKLGIFIHWGIYAVNGTSESWSFYNGQTTHDEYMAQAKGFTASAYDPQEWAKLIKESGAKYTVLTTKHHDGFALWNTKAGAISAVKSSPAKRDLLGPFADAIRAQGVKLGFYYSLLDWSHNDYPGFTRTSNKYDIKDEPQRWQKFLKFNFAQMKELDTTWKPDLYWFDGDWEQRAEDWKADSIVEMLRSTNPNVVINSRIQGYGDYATPEIGVPVVRPKERYWELCYTINDNWGYRHKDTNFKTPQMLLCTFVDCLNMGGNLLMDIGPKADGTIPQEEIDVLKAFGRWTSKHEEAIYQTRAGIPAGYFNGYTTLNKKGDVLYLYLPYHPIGTLPLKGVINTVKKIRVVGSDTELNFSVYNKLSWSEVPGVIYIDLPEKELDANITVLAVELDGPVRLYAGAGQVITSNVENVSATIPIYVWQSWNENTTVESLNTDFAKWKSHGVKGICLNAGFDVEKTRTAAKVAKSLGLEYHAWAPCMLQSGLDPSWYAVNRLGESAYDTQAYVPYYKCLDPRNPEVQQWLIDKCCRLADVPELDYVQLDYIRYVDVILAKGLWEKYNLVMNEEYPAADYCYCDHCVQDFKKLTGIDIRSVKDPSQCKEWAQFRCDAVTELVNKIASAVRAKGKKVSVDVFPGPYSHATWMVRQEWNKWNVDAFFPMNYNDFYLENAAWVGEVTEEAVAHVNGKAPVYSGLFICRDWKNKDKVTDPENSGLLPSEIEEAVTGSMRAGATGICLFTPYDMTDEHWQALDKVAGNLCCSNPCTHPGNNRFKRTTETENLLKSLKRMPEKGFMFGHHDDPLYGIGWEGDEGRSDVKSVCGDYPAVMSFDLGHIELGRCESLDDIAFERIREAIIAQYKRKGMSTISWHLNNPVTGGDAWDISDTTAVASVLPGGANHEKFLNWLDRVAHFMHSLKTEDGVKIPILFRPWHEHTGSWFWWGKKLCSAKAYKALWRLTYNRLCEKETDNLLYAYSPGSEPNTPEEYLERYPGDDIIDLVGFDCYQYNKEAYIEQMKKSLRILTEVAGSHNKAMAVTETGYETIPDPVWWTETLLPLVSTHPVSYVVVWRNARERENHYYAPYPGQISATDFVKFYENPKTLFATDVRDLTIYSETLDDKKE